MKVTHYGEFNLSGVEEGSELARTLKRLLCQMNHPSMRGRTLDLPAYLKLQGIDRLPDALT